MRDRRQLGATGPAVSALGLGCMGMSGTYGAADRDESIATIHAALDAGITLLDTGDFYGMGHNESLIADAIHGRARVRTDHIDVYRPARLDASVPIEETVGAIAELVHAGYVRYIGLSEVGADTIRRAAAVHRIVDLQIEYSLISRGIERAILPTCRELGIAVTAYGVLSRGLISGRYNATDGIPAGDIRGRMPRFEADNLRHNLALVDQLREIADLDSER